MYIRPVSKYGLKADAPGRTQDAFLALRCEKSGNEETEFARPEPAFPRMTRALRSMMMKTFPTVRHKSNSDYRPRSNRDGWETGF
jgi:hypothetical protein